MSISDQTLVTIEEPYLIFLGDVESDSAAKTAHGLVDWQQEKCLGQFRMSGCKVDLGIPELTMQEAVARGAKTLVVGVAPIGGPVSASWMAAFEQALQAGLNLASGLHVRLAEHAVLAELAAQRGRHIVDVRVPPASIPVATGCPRPGNRLLTVGTDCAVGKKYTALSLTRELTRRDVAASFRATGQTGILIAGSGVPIDATICDFTAGAAEVLSPNAAPDHWDIIEGQGSLFHPAYAGVSLALLHGSQPDALVVCHAAGRSKLSFFSDFDVPSIEDCIRRNLDAARLTNPSAACIGVSVDTSAMDEPAAQSYLADLSNNLALPCVDPLRTGTGPIADVISDGLNR